MKIADSKVFITGANRGIGRALVEIALEKGAGKVFATYRSENHRFMLEQMGEKVIPIQLDLLNRVSVRALSEKVSSLDILINNAGVFTAKNLLDEIEMQLRNDIETNFFGTLAVTKSLLPALRKEGKAAIANVSSIAGLASMPSFGGYSVSKAAIHSMTQAMRGILSPDGISVHGVYPGPIDTRSTLGDGVGTAPAQAAAKEILEGIERGVEEIFPDTMSQQVGPVFLNSPKAFEEIFAEF